MKPGIALALLSYTCLLPAEIALAETTAFSVVGRDFNLNIASIKELRFHETIRQQYDFSCGSAALATVLTYHYERPTTEQEVFDSMFNLGDQQKIQREGFSLLDMKRYLEASGLIADGFRAPLDRLLQVNIPAIVLIQKNGYRHFVVIKGLDKDFVLLGDPAAGTQIVPRADFESIWTGMLFVIRNHQSIGKRHFNRPEEWNRLARAPYELVLPASELANVTWRLRGPNDH